VSYAVVLHGRAKREFAKLSGGHKVIAADHLRRLARSPAKLGRPTVSPPFPPGEMIYDFVEDGGFETWHSFTVFFKYDAGESTLIITGIGHSEHPRGIG
jgi:hypothetical protein